MVFGDECKARAKLGGAALLIQLFVSQRSKRERIQIQRLFKGNVQKKTKNIPSLMDFA